MTFRYTKFLLFIIFFYFSGYSTLSVDNGLDAYTPMMEVQTSIVNGENSAFSILITNAVQANSNYAFEVYTDNFFQFVRTIAANSGLQFGQSSVKSTFTLYAR